MHKGADGRNRRLAGPRWAWRSGAVTTAVLLLVTGEAVAALGSVVAFSAAEVVFDAAEQEQG